MNRLWKALQLLAIVPVAVLATLATILSFAGFSNVLSGGARDLADFGGGILLGTLLLIPLFAVYCLYFAIMQEPAAIRARPWLAIMVMVGLVLGSLLAVILIPMELTGKDARLGAWTLILVPPVALAILHLFRIASARPAPVRGPSMPPPPVE
jgi:hypothetical protein